MSRIFYFLKEAFRGLFHAKLMTFVAILTIAVTLFILGMTSVGYLTIRQGLASVSSRPGIILYITDETASDSSKAGRIVSQVSKMPQAAGVFFVSKDSAWKRFETMYGREMLTAVDGNPLPASLEITLAAAYQTPDAVESFKKNLESMSGAESVQYSREWLGIIKKLHSWLAAGTAVVIPFIILALHFMIANTIKLTIYARRDLVRNMRYVGATDFYIKMPFVLEGMLQGLLGGCLGVFAMTVCRLALKNLPVCWGPPYFSTSALFGSIFLVGILFGWLGSMSAVRKFLQ
jgi:cell division transport system permease protein